MFNLTSPEPPGLLQANKAIIAVIQTLPHALLLKSSSPRDLEIGIFLYSTFFTSFWLWMHIVTLFLVPLMRPVSGIWARVTRQPMLTVEPHRVLGRVTNLVISVVMLIAAPFVLL